MRKGSENCGYLDEKICPKCGKHFIPAVENVFKTRKGDYCSWTCFNHRDDKPVRSFKNVAFYGTTTYAKAEYIFKTLIQAMAELDIPLVKCSYKGLRFETSKVIVHIIPERKEKKDLFCNECFGCFTDDEIEYLRRYENGNMPYEGNLIQYIKEKEGVKNETL